MKCYKEKIMVIYYILAKNSLFPSAFWFFRKHKLQNYLSIQRYLQAAFARHLLSFLNHGDFVGIISK